MSDTTPEAQDGPRPPQFDAPADVKAADATGYAVYDRTLGQFVGPVVHGTTKITADDAQARAPRSTVAVVRV